jgi:uncharacterized protein YbaP (TraB family)
MLKRLLVAGLLLVAIPVLAAGDKLLFWRVDTARAEIYLLGSMHLASADVYPLRTEIIEAFERSDALAVELDIGAGNQLYMQQRMIERGTYPAGQSIRDHISAQSWQKLESRLEASGLPPMLMEQMKPGLVLTTLSTLELIKLGLSTELGIDRYFLEQARGRMKIIELETIDQQLDVLLDFPQPDLLVRQSLLQFDKLEQMMIELVDYWKRGDAAGLQRLVIDDELEAHPEFAAIHRRMFDDRNRLMTDKIVEMQRSGGTYFVVVGAGHLVGDRGIVAMLKQRGQQPRQL